MTGTIRTIYSDYTHHKRKTAPYKKKKQSRKPETAAKREFRKLARESAMKRKLHKLSRQDKHYRIECDLQENTCENKIENEEEFDKWLECLKKDSLVYENLTDEGEQHAQDYALVMKFGSATVRLPYTYRYSSLYTGDCLVRYIGDKWLVLPCDLVMEDLSFLYSSCAWEHGSIGFLIDITLPKDPIRQDIKGHLLKWLY